MVARLILALALLGGLAACNTATGFIQDAENVGDAISEGT